MPPKALVLCFMLLGSAIIAAAGSIAKNDDIAGGGMLFFVVSFVLGLRALFYAPEEKTGH